jgi:hypothetical protein
VPQRFFGQPKQADLIGPDAKAPGLRAGGFVERSSQRLDFLAFFFFLAAFLPAFLPDFFAAFLDFFAAFFGAAFLAAFFFFAFLTAGFAAAFGGSAGGLIASGIGSMNGFSSSMSSPKVGRGHNDSGILGAVKARALCGFNSRET